MTALRIVAVIYRLLGSVIGLFGVIGLFVSLNPQTGANTPLGPFAVTFSLAFLLASVSCFAFAELIDYLFALQENFDRLITQTHAAETRLRTLIALNERMAVATERTAAAVETLSQSVNRNRPQ